MSFEGYYQVRCNGKPKHYYTKDCYSFDHNEKCDVCGADVEGNLVDCTNEDGVGFDPDFSNGCDEQVTIWKSQIDEMKDDIKTLYEYGKQKPFGDKDLDRGHELGQRCNEIYNKYFNKGDV